MEIIENDVELISLELRDLFTGASFDRFCYSGIYSMEFTLRQPKYGFEYCTLEIATKISIESVPKPSASEAFLMDDFHRIWGQAVDRVKLEEDLSLSLYFGSWICKIPSGMEDPEGLFDMRWTIYQSKEKDSFSVWVSDEKSIYLRK